MTVSETFKRRRGATGRGRYRSSVGSPVSLGQGLKMRIRSSSRVFSGLQQPPAAVAKKTRDLTALQCRASWVFVFFLSNKAVGWKGKEPRSQWDTGICVWKVGKGQPLIWEGGV